MSIQPVPRGTPTPTTWGTAADILNARLTALNEDVADLESRSGTSVAEPRPGVIRITNPILGQVKDVLGLRPGDMLPAFIFEQLEIPDAVDRAAMQAILDQFQAGVSATDLTISAAITDPDSQTRAALGAAVDARVGIVSVKDYVGGDGTTNDTAGLASALAAVANGGRLVIDVPVKVVGQVTASLTSEASKIIEFTRGGKILSTSVPNGSAALRLDGARNVTIINPTIQGEGHGAPLSGSGDYGIYVSGADGVSIWGGDLSQTKRSSIYVIDSKRVHVRGVYAHDATYAFAVGAIQLIRCVDSSIVDCEVANAGHKGISASEGARVRIESNSVHDIQAGDGIFVAGLTDFTITGNTVTGVGGSGDGIKVSVSGSSPPYNRAERGVISTNTVSDVNSGGGGIRLTGCRYVTVIGNEIHDVDFTAIPLGSEQGFDAVNNKIIGNTIYSATGFGIDIRDGCDDNLVSGNSIDDVPSNCIIIRRASGNLVTGNRLRPSASAPTVLRSLGGAGVNTVAANDVGSGLTLHEGENVVSTFAALHPVEVTASRTLGPASVGVVHLVTSGTLTLTLPLASTLPVGWFTEFRNISGNPLTITRQGTDTISGSATATVNTSGSLRVFRRNAGRFEVI